MWLAITLMVFFTVRWLSKKINSPFFNPMIISISALIALLLIFKVSFANYYEQNEILNLLLQPAVVALAFPLYEQFHLIRNHWKVVIIACLVGSFMAMLSAGIIAIILRMEPSLFPSLLTKSVTTPIAMEITSYLGGLSSLSAIFVMIAGISGSLIAYPIYKLLNVTHPVAKGLATGIVSHAIGTATCAEKHPQDAAFSSLALVLCGIITSLIAPFMYSLLIALNHFYSC